MKRSLAGIVWFALLSPALSLRAQDSVTTLAGQALVSGLTNGPATNAVFNDPAALVADAAGNLYIADTQNHVIRKIGTNGWVSTFAGQAGTPGSNNGNGLQAQFDTPSGIAVAANGDFYVSDTGNHIIRKITPAGAVSTIAGLAGQSGFTNGVGSAARFDSPLGITVATNGTIYVADSGNHLIRAISPGGSVTTLAGSPGDWGSADGTGDTARFNGPVGLALDDQGNLFVSDSNNHTIRKITPAGVVSAWAGVAGADGCVDGEGSAAKFYHPAELVMDRKGNLLVADSSNHAVRKISRDGKVSTVSGTAGNPGAANGSNGQGRFFNPYGLAVKSDGSLIVADAYNELIRAVIVPFTVAIQVTNGIQGSILSWDCVVGRKYQAQYNDSLNPAGWSNLGAAVTATSLALTQTDNSVPETRRVYRVLIVP